jgi:serine/threonine protein kinase
MKIVHRDLKSANCLVNNHKTIKICDFGLSRVMTDIPIRDSSSAGTPEWMAPELIRNEPVTEKCDIFSLGVIMWELCTLSRPWEGVPPKRVCLRSFISLLNIMFFSGSCMVVQYCSIRDLYSMACLSYVFFYLIIL